MIQNLGVAPLEAFTLLGDSGSRGRMDSIGQFGSGNKHGILLLLRKRIPFVICAGGIKLEFYYERRTIQESDGSQRETWIVMCQTSGKVNRKIDLNWSADFGIMDWTETRMALREFVSNAIDWAGRNGGKAEVRPEASIRCKTGHTRVFIELTPEVQEFYQNLGDNFLYFSNPKLVGETFLPKGPSVGPRVYFQGVLITTLSSQVPSAFDYNFRKGDIHIDECRNSNESVLRARIAQRVNKADAKTLAILLEQMSQGDIYEAALDDFYLSYTTNDEIKENWTSAWKEVAGDALIATTAMANSPVAEHVRHKGYRVKEVRSNTFVNTAIKFGVKDIASAVGQHAAQGRVECETTPFAQQAVDTVWGWIESLNLTKGKSKPSVRSFHQLMDGEEQTHGFYVPGTDYVNINRDFEGREGIKTALEEVGHYVTGSTDMSRDFQEFFITMVVEACI